jgi:starvation-inducible DNA-binding protein
MVKDQHRELAVTVTDIADGIRILDIAAPCTYKKFTRLTAIHAGDGGPTAIEMIDVLLVGHEIDVKSTRVVRLVSDRMRRHKKNIVDVERFK